MLTTEMILLVNTNLKRELCLRILAYSKAKRNSNPLSRSQITFYGGIHEIGGNKFLLEDKGTKVFLDFGMQMGKVNQYFKEFVNPRICNGMGNLFEFELLPKFLMNLAADSKESQI